MASRRPPESQFVAWIDDADYAASTTRTGSTGRCPTKPRLPSRDPRVVDQNGEHYLFPTDAFVRFQVLERIRDSVRRAA